MMNLWIVALMMFLFGNLIFVSKHKHLLIVLMSLEFIVLSIFFFMLMLLSMIKYDLYILMIFLVFSVCEGVLGLSILVSIIRFYGNDYLQSFNLI
uniref:NADH-ubiquinone oxidoreductase chain 4L n=1 Tax=Elymnias hypermnestra TaxID=366056 RepID=A0A0A7AJ20_9NEOP|nr:NADH dehydrogenase subunit 4L [Elymnias hypermnestra]AHH92966.1 NADH dehydrogenase subunit 4L [Elymnias hypermnestra]